jgi:hypothetical protein
VLLVFDVSVDAGFLCDKAALLGVVTKTLCNWHIAFWINYRHLTSNKEKEHFTVVSCHAPVIFIFETNKAINVMKLCI